MRLSTRSYVVIGAGATALGGLALYFVLRRRRAAPPVLKVYPPGSPEQVSLFEAAARLVGLPARWARSSGLANILRRESGGWVGVPNFRYGDRAKDKSRWPEIWAELRRHIYTGTQITAREREADLAKGLPPQPRRSGATGLGQLQPDNVDKLYPSGRAGIGVPIEEAAGMLRYIKERYGTPEIAWAKYGTKFPGY